MIRYPTFLITRELTPEECVHRLASKRVGRITVTTPQGRKVSSVSYVVDKGCIVLRLNSSEPLGSFRWEKEVTFAADLTDDARREAWSVVLHGHGKLLDGYGAKAVACERGLDAGTGGDHVLYVRLVGRMSGREVAWSEQSESASARLRVAAQTL